MVLCLRELKDMVFRGRVGGGGRGGYNCLLLVSPPVHITQVNSRVKFNPSKTKKDCLYSGRRLYQYNEDDFRIQF